MPFRIGPPRPLIIAPRFIDSIEATSSVPTFSEEDELLRLGIVLVTGGDRGKQLIQRGPLEHGQAQDL
jgi:hypothetical protein